MIGRRVPFAELIAPDPEARPPDELQREQVPDPEPHRAATHLLPSEGDGEYLTSCCGRSPFDLNASREQLVIRQEQVTCPGGESR